MSEISEIHLRALELRKQGISYREISTQLGVARSTLSGWLRDVPLTEKQKEKLHNKWIQGLSNARSLAAEWHREVKRKQLARVESEASDYLKNYVIDKKMLELFLVGLYLGDGFKTNGRLGFGNADPTLVKMFVSLITRLYPIDHKRLKVQLFIRVDQNIDEVEEYWSNLLDIPRSQFHKIQVDKRAVKPTIVGYHGVCAVVYPSTQLQRRILAIGKEMVKYTSNLKTLGS